MMSRQALALVAAVALGGALGSVARYGAGTLIQGRAGPDFPVATLLINVLGSFLLGAILRFAIGSTAMSPELRLFLATGFCGGFTTFSTFSVETVRLLEDGRYRPAAAYVGLSVGLSLVATVGGFALARRLLGARA